jgi:hypothetical protein
MRTLTQNKPAKLLQKNEMCKKNAKKVKKSGFFMRFCGFLQRLHSCANGSSGAERPSAFGRSGIRLGWLLYCKADVRNTTTGACRNTTF